MIDVDLARLELVLAADIGEVPRLDPHTLTASKIFRIPYEQVDAAQRQIGKQYNFLEYYNGKNINIGVDRSASRNTKR
jgi:hypothetical protein